jgi:hypothetical protein
MFFFKKSWYNFVEFEIFSDLIYFWSESFKNFLENFRDCTIDVKA